MTHFHLHDFNKSLPPPIPHDSPEAKASQLPSVGICRDRT